MVTSICDGSISSSEALINGGAVIVEIVFELALELTMTPALASYSKPATEVRKAENRRVESTERARIRLKHFAIQIAGNTPEIVCLINKTICLLIC